MKLVKSQKELKATWSALRRQITPKIGQLTNDPQEITRMVSFFLSITPLSNLSSQSQQIHDIIVPPSAPPHPPHIHHALLSTLAKSILQAETEVTAEKRSAKQLAHVAANLLGALSQFPEVFFAKLVQRARVGGL